MVASLAHKRKMTLHNHHTYVCSTDFDSYEGRTAIKQKVGIVVGDIVSGAGGLGFDSLVCRIGLSRQQLETAATCLYCQGAKLRRLAPTRYPLRCNAASMMKIRFLTVIVVNECRYFLNWGDIFLFQVPLSTCYQEYSSIIFI